MLFNLVYRVLVLLYPPAHRQQYGRVQGAHMEEWVAEARSPIGKLTRRLVSLLELFPSIAHEWMAVIRGSEPYESVEQYLQHLHLRHNRPSYVTFLILVCTLVGIGQLFGGLQYDALTLSGLCIAWIWLSFWSFRRSHSFMTVLLTLGISGIVFQLAIRAESGLYIPVLLLFATIWGMNTWWEHRFGMERLQIAQSAIAQGFVRREHRIRGMIRFISIPVLVVFVLQLSALGIQLVYSAGAPKNTLPKKTTKSRAWTELSSTTKYTMPKSAFSLYSSSLSQKELRTINENEGQKADLVLQRAYSFSPEDWEDRAVETYTNSEDFWRDLAYPDGITTFDVTVDLILARNEESPESSARELGMLYEIFQRQANVRISERGSRFSLKNNLRNWYRTIERIAPTLSIDGRGKLLDLADIDHQQLLQSFIELEQRENIYFVRQKFFSTPPLPTTYLWIPALHADQIQKRYEGELMRYLEDCTSTTHAPEQTMAWYGWLLPNSTGRKLETLQSNDIGAYYREQRCALDEARAKAHTALTSYN